MSTIENNFAALTGNVGNAFSGSILGQANRIQTLQDNGVAAYSGGAGVSLAGNGSYLPQLPQASPAMQLPRTVEEGIAMVNRDPSLIPRAIKALQDPSILRAVLSTLQQKPELVQAIPLQVQQFLHYLLSNGTGAACGR